MTFVLIGRAFFWRVEAQKMWITGAMHIHIAYIIVFNYYDNTHDDTHDLMMIIVMISSII